MTCAAIIACRHCHAPRPVEWNKPCGRCGEYHYYLQDTERHNEPKKKDCMGGQCRYKDYCSRYKKPPTSKDRKRNWMLPPLLLLPHGQHCDHFIPKPQ